MTATIISVVQQKGGVGKSTICMNVAGAYVEAGYKVLVVDADPQGSALSWAAAAPEGTPFPAHVSGLAQMGTKLHTELRRQAEDYDIILVDTPPHADAPQPRSALKMSDFALLPMQCTPIDLNSSYAERALVFEIAEVNEDLKARVLFSRVDKRLVIGREVAKAMRDFGIPTIEPGVRQRKSLQEAYAFGTCITSMEPKSQEAQDFRNLAENILKHIAEDEPVIEYIDRVLAAEQEASQGVA
ncbi:hypothetical protein CKO28_14195 [Rhodovibrio sodomensis]|uniref:CobQ/CobB/MinD/ParA nucleotide binding domain-containing protein n=1 Tax=Rhodovibrio sodomensis TaxID=1088 RepID=A0ABS1DH64_9PROT|nr:ParA family partition ATPase [Rhodovibrio sodomensis]MBK1669184.1 hypothetical protein [Rhodovibrio sodomensis]